MFEQFARSIGANRTVIALSFARLGDAVGNSILFIIIPIYVARLPSPWFPFPDSVRIGILIALYGIVNAALQPFMGALSDRLGRRKLLIQIGLLVMAIATLGFLLAGRFVDLLVLRSMQGVGVALSIPASMAIMTTSSQRESRGGSMGIYSTMRMSGFVVGPLVGGFLYDHFGFDAAFYAGAAFIGLGVLFVQLWVPEVPAGKRVRREKVKVFDRSLYNWGIVGAGLATFIMANDFAMISALENEFNARLDQSAFGFGVAFSALMVSRLLFQIPLGRWSDTIGRKPVVILGLILIAPATALLGEATSTLQLTLLRLLQGLASAAIAAPAFALAGDLSSSGNEGRQMSVITMGFGLGIALGPLLAGLLAVVFFELPFLLGGAASLLVAWIVHRYVPETVATNRTSA